jgi:hypothetical protein
LRQADPDHPGRHADGNIPAALLTSAKSAGTELDLAVDISPPANLSIHPGELVDLTLAAKAD